MSGREHGQCILHVLATTQWQPSLTHRATLTQSLGPNLALQASYFKWLYRTWLFLIQTSKHLSRPWGIQVKLGTLHTDSKNNLLMLP